MHVYARYFSNEIEFFLESSKELCERRHIQSLPTNGGRSGMYADINVCYRITLQKIFNSLINVWSR